MKRDPLIDIYMKDICRTPLLTREEELRLARRVQRGDTAARDHMIRANLRLVVKIAGNYRNCGLSFSDLVAEGNTGLMVAVERFDPEIGAKLSTYSAWWIKQRIRRALSNQSRNVRLPVHMVEKIAKVNAARIAVEEETGRRAYKHELLEATGLDRKQLRLVLESGQTPVSLDAPVSGDDRRETPMHERLADSRKRDPLEELSDANLVSQIEPLLGVLADRERKIIEARFGLGGRVPQILEQIGKEFGVTRERIRQIQNAALAKMRAELCRRETLLPAVMRP